MEVHSTAIVGKERKMGCDVNGWSWWDFLPIRVQALVMSTPLFHHVPLDPRGWGKFEDSSEFWWALVEGQKQWKYIM